MGVFREDSKNLWPVDRGRDAAGVVTVAVFGFGGVGGGTAAFHHATRPLGGRRLTVRATFRQTLLESV